MKTYVRAISKLAMANTFTDALTKKPIVDAHSVVSTRFNMKMKNLSAAVSSPVLAYSQFMDSWPD